MSAKEIYDICCDMDYVDYSDSYDNDLEYVQTFIDQYGAMNALEKLLDVVGL